MTEPPSRPSIFVRRAFAVILLVVGLVLAVGGGDLLLLGGSPYYLLAGLATLASGALVWRGDRRARLIYAALLVVTLGWAVWEAGFDGWALNARLLAPAILGLGFLLPPVAKRPASLGGWAAFAASLAIAVVVGAALHPAPPSDPIFQRGVAAPPARMVSLQPATGCTTATTPPARATAGSTRSRPPMSPGCGSPGRCTSADCPTTARKSWRARR